jgi:hypothetical protein
MARNFGFPTLEDGLSVLSKDELADNLAYNNLKVRKYTFRVVKNLCVYFLISHSFCRVLLDRGGRTSLSRVEPTPCVPTSTGSSRAREPLYLYIAAAIEVLSMVLVVERTAQHPQGSQKVPLGEGGGPTTMMVMEGQEFEGSGPTPEVRTI